MSETSDTGSGIIVGVEPAKPRTQADWGAQQRPDQAVSQPVQQDRQSQDRPAYRWTDEDIENARRQEKEKLYPRLEDMDAQLKALRDEREAEKAERDRLAKDADEARRQKEESEMDLRQLLEKREQEWNSQVSEIKTSMEQQRAVYEKERQLQEAEIYRRDRIAQEAENILPELRDFIQGSTPEEIDQSIETMKARTESVIANFVAQEPVLPFQQPRGAAPTAPPVGPMEQLPDYTNLSPDDIRGMDMDTYKKYREQLLQATSPRNRRLPG